MRCGNVLGALGILGVAATWAACASDSGRSGEPEAGADATSTEADSAASAGDTSTVTPPRDTGSDAREAGPPGVDAGEAGSDASGGDATTAVDSGPVDAATVVDGGPGSLVTMADVPSLWSFDFEGATLVARVSATELVTCTVPGCGAPTPIPGVTLRTPDGAFTVAQGNIYYTCASSVGSAVTALCRSPFTGGGTRIEDSPGTLTGGSCTQANTNPVNGQNFVECGGDRCFLSGGSRQCTGGTFTGKVLTAFGSQDNPSVLLELGSVQQRYFQYHTLRAAPAAARLQSVPSASTAGSRKGARHTNGDGSITFTPPLTLPAGRPATLVVGGATVPFLDAYRFAASPRTVGGVALDFPTVAVTLGGGEVRACPVKTACPAWIDLGLKALAISLDDTYLYVGDANGLGRCTQAEIATLGTCTLAPLVTTEAVQEPLYVTPTHLWYRSGTRVQRLTL